MIQVHFELAFFSLWVTFATEKNLDRVYTEQNDQ